MHKMWDSEIHRTQREEDADTFIHGRNNKSWKDPLVRNNGHTAKALWIKLTLSIVLAPASTKPLLAFFILSKKLMVKDY